MMRYLGIAMVALLLLACDPYIGRPNRAVGLSLASDGRIEITRRLCSRDQEVAERVKEIRLLLHPGTVIGDPGDDVAWDLVASSDSVQETFIGGQVTPGFVQVVAFEAGLSPDDDLGVLTETNVSQAVVQFRLDQLRQGMVFSQGGLLTPEQFEQQASSVCAGG